MNTGMLSNSPIIRVGIVENYNCFDIKCSNKYSIYDNEGIAVARSINHPSIWKLKVDEKIAALYSYSIVIADFAELTHAQEMQYEYLEKGMGVRIVTYNDKIDIDNNVIKLNQQFSLIIDGFETRDLAKEFISEHQDLSNAHIEENILKEPDAQFKIFDSYMEKIGELKKRIRFVPETEDTIFSLSFYNELIHEREPEHKIELKYPVEICVTNDTKLCIIVELPLEQYIAEVLSPLKNLLPNETLRALSVIIRSKTLSAKCIKHKNDSFDVCATEHCEQYSGYHDENPVIQEIIAETFGKVLYYNGRVLFADHSDVCGGHTESPQNIDYEIVGIPDMSTADVVRTNDDEIQNDLSVEEEFKNSYSNPQNTLCGNCQIPEMAAYHKYYRWEISYSNSELEKLINNKLDIHIGTIYNLLPLNRGISGRILKLEIIAEHRNLILEGENNICEFLSERRLPSSAFFISFTEDKDSIPYQFTFHGMGKGDGVGLCLLGSASLSNMGWDYKRILNHYFMDASIRKIY